MTEFSIHWETIVSREFIQVIKSSVLRILHWLLKQHTLIYPLPWHTHSPEDQEDPGLPQEQRGQQAEGGDSALHSTLGTPHLECAALGSTTWEGHGPDGAGPERHKVAQRAWSSLLWKQVEGAGLIQPGEASKETSLWSSSTLKKP